MTAVVSKYIFRSRTANVFNPAALAIIATFYVFHTGQSWWGALPELPLAAQLALIAGGVFIAGRVNKMPLVLTFLGAYYVLFTITAFVADPRWVSEVLPHARPAGPRSTSRSSSSPIRRLRPRAIAIRFSAG